MILVRYIYCLIPFLLFPIALLSQNTDNRKRTSIGIQSGFNNPFHQQEDLPKSAIQNSDTIKSYLITRRDNSLRIKFSGHSRISVSNFFDSLNKELGISTKEKLNLIKAENDDIGFTHYRYQQTYMGIKVEGGELLLHEKAGFLKTANGYFFDSLNINVTPNISPATAINNAKKEVGAEKWMWENNEAEKFLKEATENKDATYLPKAELIISAINGIFKVGNFRLCYKINIAAEKPYGIYDVYIDAHTGKVVNRISQIHDLSYPVTGSATTLYSGTKTITTDSYNGSYRLRDYNRGNGIETYDLRGIANISSGYDFTDADNNWTQETFIKQVNINSLNNNWHPGDYPSLGGKPDTYFIIKNSNNTEVYRSATYNNASPPFLYHLNVMLTSPPYTMEIWDDDLINDDLINSFQLVLNNGINSYSSGDGTNITYDITTENNPALDVHWGIETTYDFFKAPPLLRNSYDNMGSKIKNYINVNNSLGNGLPNNAYASPNYFMVFGLGDGTNYSPLVSLDVTGHEFSHMVIRKTANLIYQNESGALNESFADIFGTAIEFYGSPSTANWKIGENVVQYSPNYMRDMSNPNSGVPHQPDTYLSTYQAGPWHPTSFLPSSGNDWGGVHYNSGVQNFWFYLLSQGGSGTNDKGQSYSVAGITRDKAIRIAYRNLTHYLTSSATYPDAAEGSIEATLALYGLNSTELQSVINAWYAVGVLNSPGAFCGGTTNLTATSSTFQDGSGSTQYQNNADCRWLIQPSGANSITLNFSEFNTEAIGDSVFVYDGSTIASNLLLQWSGNSLPTSVTSTTGAMLVRFKTDATTTANGWLANYTSGTTTSYCTGNTILNTSFGSLSDGSGNNNYGNNAQCSWLIAPPGATSITLSFTSFETQTGADGIIIYDGNNTNTPVLGTFSGSSLPPPITSTGGEMLVVFTSNNTISAPGWSASYTSTGSAYCSGTTNLTALAGTFSDGSGSNNYQNNADCKWLIQPPGATSVTLSFTSFDLELSSPDGQSIYDAVEVFDGTTVAAPLLGRFTGNSLPPSLTSTGGSILVRFYSDFSVVKQGWDASYTSATQGYCSGTTIFTSASGSFADGSGANQYVENADCNWLIRPANATSIVLNFNSFETEQNYDGVIVYDGDNVFAPVLGVFTGTTIPPQVYSTGGSMLIRFISDESINASGWAASYVANISSGGSGSIMAYEYWFDNNYVNRIYNSIIPENSSIISTTIPATGLNSGLHTLNIRFKSNEDNWSSITSSFFYKPYEIPAGTAQYEYWFDNNYSNKTQVNNNSTNNFDLLNDLPVSSLSEGLHTLHIRFKPDGKTWSSTVSSFFYKADATPSGNAEYEYWFDNNYAGRTTTSISGTAHFILLDSIITNTITNGLHTLHYRFRPDGKTWSSVTSSFFYKDNNSITGINNLAQYVYWFDYNWQNPQTITITGVQNLNWTLNTQVDSLSNGPHVLSQAFKDDKGQWSSIVSTDFTKQPASTPVCLSAGRQFIAGVIAGGTATYQWQLDSGSGFTDISNNAVYSGADADTLQLTNAPTSWYGYKFRCRVTNGATILYGPVYTLKFASTWTGGIDETWENPANWSCGIIPDANTDVYVNSASPRYPQVNSTTATCRSLNLQPGTSFEVKPGFTITITGKD